MIIAGRATNFTRKEKKILSQNVFLCISFASGIRVSPKRGAAKLRENIAQSPKNLLVAMYWRSKS